MVRRLATGSQPRLIREPRPPVDFVAVVAARRRTRRQSRRGRAARMLATSFGLIVVAGRRLRAARTRPRLHLDGRAIGARAIVAAPRLMPHGLVLSMVVAAILAGGFHRPENGFVSAMIVEHGHLSVQARLALGPRAADVQVRDSLVRPALSTTTLTPSRPRAEAIVYQVQPGDTVWGIGARFNVGLYSVLWSNGLDDRDVVILQPGQELRVPPVPGVLHTVTSGDTLDSIARRYSVDPAVIVDFNELKPGEPLLPDKVLVVPGGTLPIAPRPAPAPPVQRQPVAPAPPPRPPQPAPPPARPPVTVPVPAPPVPAAPTGRFSWPTRGVITTYFSGWHPGIDIAAPIGTPISASDGGRVEFAGWDGSGYGYRIIVNHGNGYTSTYNHLSVISVRIGQQVGKGQVIGSMGSTGRSTGPHLHFEILRNGQFVNPLGMLG